MYIVCVECSVVIHYTSRRSCSGAIVMMMMMRSHQTRRTEVAADVLMMSGDDLEGTMVRVEFVSAMTYDDYYNNCHQEQDESGQDTDDHTYATLV